MIKLIADSGSTKTDWCVCSKGNILHATKTEGINPFHQTESDINHIINSLHSLLSNHTINQIDFYGAGCALLEKQELIKNILSHYFPQAIIHVESDLLGAARALCQNEAGIACILGTGSNSCEYNGKNIISNTPALGYILGDEGSGAVLGKHLINKCLKNQLPDNLSRKFMEQYQLTQAIILERVYRQPMPNRFLASISPFLAENREEPIIQELIVNAFKEFFQHNVLQYNTSLPVHFVGSIAYIYKREIEMAAQSFSLTIGNTMRSPMDGLTAFTPT